MEINLYTPDPLWGVCYAGDKPVLLELRYVRHCRRYLDQHGRVWRSAWLILDSKGESLVCECMPGGVSTVTQHGDDTTGRLTAYPLSNLDAPGMYEDRELALELYASMCEAAGEQLLDDALQARKEIEDEV
jgi:hypothetical protein